MSDFKPIQLISTLFAAGALALSFFAAPAALAQESAYHGTPTYENAAAEALVQSMIAAHGGMDGFLENEALRFNFFTKVVLDGGRQPPFYSVETVDLNSGASDITWPLMNARTVWNGTEMWSVGFPPPLPAGFFAHLTTSFITLPCNRLGKLVPRFTSLTLRGSS